MRLATGFVGLLHGGVVSQIACAVKVLCATQPIPGLIGPGCGEPEKTRKSFCFRAAYPIMPPPDDRPLLGPLRRKDVNDVKPEQPTEETEESSGVAPSTESGKPDENDPNMPDPSDPVTREPMSETEDLSDDDDEPPIPGNSYTDEDQEGGGTDAPLSLLGGEAEPTEADKPGNELPEGAAQRLAVGVRPRPAGPMEYFWARHHALKPRMKVVVEAERGLAIGQVCTQPFPHEPRPGAQPLRNVVRIADERDKLIEAENKTRNREALVMCREMIVQLGLPMKLIAVEYQHSANKATFFFASEGRVDFRELVRQLAQQLRIRVEMRQIGIRDEAKLLGGLGPCGLPVCCASFLDDFAPVSIRQAKEQNLTLNPEKVSGLCGRLMCCLGYESATYRGEQEGLPKIGKKADTWKGRGRVLEINIFSRLMRMELEGREYVTINIDDYRSYKEDPEGFSKIMAEREEEERRQAVEKLNSGAGGAGGRNRRRETRPKPASAPAATGPARTLPEAREERDTPPAGNVRPTPAPRPESAAAEGGDEASQQRRSRGSRRRRRRPEDGGTPGPASGETPNRERPPRQPAPVREGINEQPQRESGDSPDDPARPRPRRRGGRRRGGRRPGEGSSGGGGATSGSSGSEG